MRSSSSVIRGARPAEEPVVAGEAGVRYAFSPFPAPAAAQRTRPAAEVLAEAEYRRGFEAGQAEGQAGCRAELEGLRTALDLVVQEVWEHREQLYREVEPDVVRLALEVAGRVVGRVAEEDRTLAERLVAEALKRVTARDRVTVRVNPEDLEAVRAYRERWLSMVEGVAHLEVVEDRRVPRGGALVTTRDGAVDARWTTQLVEIERMLLGERRGTDPDA
ncbi:MAG TPA: FliH/SctL family protein [Candidatus Saccharimonadales bacterium]|nr:FliH/SctL family protein [Candidatus Saccharimonadales bacterium]